jgi:hypothetical protein
MQRNFFIQVDQYQFDHHRVLDADNDPDCAAAPWTRRQWYSYVLPPAQTPRASRKREGVSPSIASMQEKL